MYVHVIYMHEALPREVWGHAPQENFEFYYTFWDHFWCNLGMKLVRVTCSQT